MKSALYTWHARFRACWRVWTSVWAINSPGGNHERTQKIIWQYYAHCTTSREAARSKIYAGTDIWACNDLVPQTWVIKPKKESLGCLPYTSVDADFKETTGDWGPKMAAVQHRVLQHQPECVWKQRAGCPTFVVCWRRCLHTISSEQHRNGGETEWTPHKSTRFHMNCLTVGSTKCSIHSVNPSGVFEVGIKEHE